jgi:hypothetical protein
VVAVGIVVLMGSTTPANDGSNGGSPPGTSGVITVPAPTHTGSGSTTPSSSNPAQGLPTITLGGTWTGREPSTIGFSGDAGNVVTNIAWASWTDAGAIGHGTWESESCVPDCATGSTVPYPATITLSHLTGGQFTALVEQTHGMSQSYALPGTTVGPWGS